MGRLVLFFGVFIAATALAREPFESLYGVHLLKSCEVRSQQLVDLCQPNFDRISVQAGTNAQTIEILLFDSKDGIPPIPDPKTRRLILSTKGSWQEEFLAESVHYDENHADGSSTFTTIFAGIEETNTVSFKHTVMHSNANGVPTDTSFATLKFLL